jgi:hypothetical protein
VAQDHQQLVSALDGIDDPMANFLRRAANDAGGIDGGWPAILDGLGQETQCPPETERSFVVLSNLRLHPKGIVTRCADDPTAASRFFMVFEPDLVSGDLDGQGVRVAAWDESAAMYRRYQMVGREGDELGVAVEPDFCRNCHGGPFDMGTWTPIMNEMTNPWAQWNAEPGFESLSFDEAFPADAGGPLYDEIASTDRLTSASDLEPIVRAGIDRVSNARLAARHDGADFDVALSLLRPMFCDESVNFVSEIHDSGELPTQALVDPGLRRALLGLAQGQGWPWGWVTDPTVRIDPPEADDTALVMIAVRGETTVQAEAALLSRQVVDAQQLLAVRALDWQHPVFSELRCGLWEAAAQRVEASQTGLDPATFVDNATLAAALYDEAMQWPTATGLVSLRSSTPGTVVALPDGEAANATAALDAGDLASLQVSPTQLGEQVDAYVTAQSTADARPDLTARWHRRGCLARSTFPSITPLIPGLDDCAAIPEGP